MQFGYLLVCVCVCVCLAPLWQLIPQSFQRLLAVTVAKDVHHQDTSVGSSSVESLHTKSSYTLLFLMMYIEHFAKWVDPPNTSIYLPVAAREEMHLISRLWGMVPRSLNHHLLPLSVSGSNLQGAGRQMGHTRHIADDT